MLHSILCLDIKPRIINILEKGFTESEGEKAMKIGDEKRKDALHTHTLIHTYAYTHLCLDLCGCVYVYVYICASICVLE